jgi:phosphoglycerate dehydrogenase-like enzyme
MPRVLVNPKLLRDRGSACVQTLVTAGFDVVTPRAQLIQLTPHELVPLLRGVDAVVAGLEPYPKRTLAGSRLRVLSRAGVGFDAVDLRAATELGIVVTVTKGATSLSAAEHTLSLMFAVFRRILARDADIRQGGWARETVPRLSGKILGIIGLGSVGKAVASRAKALGLVVVAHDPVWDAVFAAANEIGRVSLDALLAKSDIVSLHAPATPETTGLIDAAALQKMRPGSILINTARGKLVDERALAESLDSNRLAGAGLDVFETEPLPSDSPLRQAPNTVLTPHTAGLDEESGQTMATMAARNIVDLYAGRWPQENVVNGELQSNWHW